MNRKHLHNTEVSPVLTDKDSAEPIRLPTGKEIRKAYQLSRVMGLASLHLPRQWLKKASPFWIILLLVWPFLSILSYGSSGS